LAELRFGLRDTALFDYSPENEMPPPIYERALKQGAMLPYQDSTPDLMDLDDDDDDDDD
jgi:hypothetical protein